MAQLARSVGGIGAYEDAAGSDDAQMQRRIQNLGWLVERLGLQSGPARGDLPGCTTLSVRHRLDLCRGCGSRR